MSRSKDDVGSLEAENEKTFRKTQKEMEERGINPEEIAALLFTVNEYVHMRLKRMMTQKTLRGRK